MSEWKQFPLILETARLIPFEKIICRADPLSAAELHVGVNAFLFQAGIHRFSSPWQALVRLEPPVMKCKAQVLLETYLERVLKQTLSFKSLLVCVIAEKFYSLCDWCSPLSGLLQGASSDGRAGEERGHSGAADASTRRQLPAAPVPPSHLQ